MTLPSRFLLLLSLLVISYNVVESQSLRRGTRALQEDETPQEEMQELMDEEAFVTELSEKLAPVKLTTLLDPATHHSTLAKHSFLHLHHMKTGGTSMDGLLNCAMRRMKKDKQNSKIEYMNIHECGLNHYRSCRDGENPKCRNSINDASILSYCAPLMDLEKFGWSTHDVEQAPTEAAVEEAPKDDAADEEATDTDTQEEATDADNDAEEAEPPSRSLAMEILPTKPHAVTVLRHPINRVWSMYRFQTKRCYSCKTLIEIYNEIDSGSTTMDETCSQQLLNHQTRNLVQEWDESDVDKMLKGALYNLHNFFTFVGLTEQMNETATMVGMVFPFMNETVNGDETNKCSMPHRNASPQNNRCGPGGKHWDLPPHPDDATAMAIMKHNQMDTKLYEQAEQLFEYQKMALGLKKMPKEAGEEEGDEVQN